MKSAVYILILLCRFAWGAVSGDEVQSLPGWDHPLPSKMYSGFIECGTSPIFDKMFMHYMFIESEGNPETDPVLMWYNGGPGASSMFGSMVELGPLLLDERSVKTAEFNKTGIPTFQRNEYSWSKHASLLVVNSPPPVGFSYCETAGPSGDPTSCGAWNDTYVGEANKNFVINWFKSYPEYLKNELYISGESYAGVYVPIIADALLSCPEAKNINLKGFITGDGCLGTDVICDLSKPLPPWGDLQFFYGHNQMSSKMYRRVNAGCTEEELKSGDTNPVCTALLKEMYSSLGGYFEYSLYDECFQLNDFATGPKNQSMKWYGKPLTAAAMELREERALLKGALNDYPCAGAAMPIWVNLSAARKALNVDVDSFWFSGDNGASFVYQQDVKSVFPIYERVFKNTDLRVIVYNGDTDPSLSTQRTEDMWTNGLERMGMSETEAWRPWTLDGRQRMAGYVFRYGERFTYVSVRGSGHMVPEYKPQAAFDLISRFLTNAKFPAYSP